MANHNLRFRRPPLEGPLYQLIFGQPSAEPCAPEWAPQEGSDIRVDIDTCVTITVSDDWVDLPGNELDFSPQGAESNPAGDAVDFALGTHEEVVPDWEDQAGDAIDLDYYCCAQAASVELDPLAYTGETMEASLQRSTLLNFELYTGEQSSVDLTTAPQVLIPVGFDIGETLVPTLWTEVVLPAEAYEGATMAGDLATLPAALLDAPAYTGEQVNASLSPVAGLQPDFYTGEQGSATLDTQPNAGMPADGYTGELLELDLLVTSGFPVTFSVGEVADLALSTESLLVPEAHHGETVTFDLYVGAPAFMDAPAYTGEQLTAALSVQGFNLGDLLVHDSATFDADVTTNPQPEITLSFPVGETALLPVMSWAANLGDMDMPDGATAVVGTLDEEENLHLYAGEEMLVSMATEDSFPFTVHEGAQAAATLKDAPSEPLGQLDMFAGEQTVNQLTVLRGIPMAVTFFDSYTTAAGIDASTFLDLDISCCSNHEPGQQDIHKIELNEAEFPDQRFDGDRIRLDISLQTQPRFQFSFHEGATMVGVDIDPTLGAARMSTGEGASINAFEAKGIDFKLCPGNFIPDGDNVYVELDTVDYGECYADYVFEGATMGIGTLQAHQNFQHQMTTGETMVFDLSTGEPWRIDFHHGEVFQMASTADLPHQYHHGETAELKFYEPPILAATGEAVTATLVIQYEVEFLEVGCLDNNYIYQDENGDPLPAPFGVVPVEMEPFQHDIAAQCK